MTLKKPDLQILTVWRLRLLLAAILPAALLVIFASRRNLVWGLLTAAWTTGFLYAYIFYYPIKYRKLAYAINQSCLLLHCGVIYTRVKAIPLSSIQYITIASSPLERLFGIRTLLVYAAGSSLWIPGLPPEDALLLKRALIPEEGEDHPD